MSSLAMRMKAIKTVDQGLAFQYILKAPNDLAVVPDSGETLVVPVLKRRDGLMLAVPKGFFFQETLDQANAAAPTDLLGPNTAVVVPAVFEEEDGSETVLGIDLEVILIDVGVGIADYIRLFDPVTEGEGTLCFYESSVETYPSPQPMLETALNWIQTSAEDRVGFYTAVEEEGVMKASPKASPAPKKASKKVTTASLAEQVSAIAGTLPAVLEQLTSLQDKQMQLESMMSSARAQERVPAYRQDFPIHTPKAPFPAVAKFMQEIGPPPKAKTPGTGLPQNALIGGNSLGDEPTAAPCEEGFMEQMGLAAHAEVEGGSVQQMLLQQSQALTTLVAHLASQDGFHDLAGTGSGTSLSMKGSARREKLLNDLASRKGNFMLKVAQNAFRRLRPSEPVPQSLEDFQGKPLFAKYLERHGGYSANRDLGLIMWLLCQMADQMVQGDPIGAMEMLALTMTSIEQAAQDGGKWEVAWLLSLQEDPPAGVFGTRPASSNPRLRAFAPLCPAEWAATSLSYVKELDIINSRRQEAIPGKKPKKEEEKEPPKRPPRTPKKPKGTSKGEKGEDA